MTGLDLYPCVQGVGLGSHIALAGVLGSRLGVPPRLRSWISASYVVGMTLGAHGLAHVLGARGIGCLDRECLWGGALIYLILASAVVARFARRDPQQWRRGLDLIALAAPIPMAMAKVGCLFAGCCYGTPCAQPWAIVYPVGHPVAPGGITLHPAQLYDVLVLLALGLVVLWLSRWPRWRGTLLGWWVGLYGLGRAATEVWRAHPADQVYWAGLTPFQAACLAAAAACAVLLIWRACR